MEKKNYLRALRSSCTAHPSHHSRSPHPSAASHQSHSSHPSHSPQSSQSPHTSAASQRLEQLKDICQQYQMALAYLFGSQKDTAYQLMLEQKVEITDPLADIDLGLVFKSHAAPRLPRHVLYAELYNKLSELFLPYPLDLVFLQEGHSVFQFEAVKGICVYAISEAFKDDYEMMVLRRAGDFKYTLEMFAREALEQF